MRNKGLWTLVLISSIVPELVTGSTLPQNFFNLGQLIMLALGYAIPVLLIRELAVRNQTTLSGLMVMGLGLGIVNEGLLAKTLVHVHGLPINQFDGYGYAFGIDWPWASFMCLWHALASTVFPILLAHYFWPETAERPWISERAAIALAILLVGLSSFLFLGFPIQGAVGKPAQLALLYLLAAGSVGLGLRLRGGIPVSQRGPSFKPFLLGISVLAPEIVLMALAYSKVNLAVYFIFFCAIVAMYCRVFVRRNLVSLPVLICFGVGWYAYNAVVSIVILGVMNPGVGLMAAACDAAALAYLWRRIVTSSGRAKESPVAPTPAVA